MSLFDMVKGKAAELLTRAGDKVNELSGIDLPGGDRRPAHSPPTASPTPDKTSPTPPPKRDRTSRAPPGNAAASAVTDAIDPRPGS
jgi:hypothetical protein